MASFAESIFELLGKSLLVAIVIMAAVLLWTPYEAYVEGLVAFLILAATVAGFLMYPRRDVYFVRTTVPRMNADRQRTVEHDVVAVKVELTKLWVLFLVTALAEAVLVFLAAGGPEKFSVLNWLFLYGYGFYFTVTFWIYLGVYVVLLLAAWVGERRVMRDAEACSARSISVDDEPEKWQFRRVSYLFMGDHGEYLGGSCWRLGRIHRGELGRIVFHDVKKPELNKISMVFMFHRLRVLARGVTDLDKETMVAQMALAETRPLS